MSVKIGLRKAYYAKLLSDDPVAVIYAAPVALAAIQQAQVNPKVSRVQVPGDDIIQEDLTQCLGADVTVQRKEFTLEEEAVLLGRVTDANGGVYGGETDKPPYVAFGYMRSLNDGSGLYVWLLKTKFAPSNSTADTKPTDNITPQYDSMTATAITRTADGQWIYSRKSSDPNFGDTFFTQATLQAIANGAAPTAIALSSSTPADDATGVSKSAALTLTFNNKIMSEDVSLVKDDGSIVAVTKTFDATGKILTITHAALSGTSHYMINVNGVVDIYGQKLAASVIYFTTAA